MSLRIDHIGIVVRDVGAALASYLQVLGLPHSACTSSVVRDPETGEDIDVGFLHVGDNRIEFIGPRPGSRSRFAEHLARNGESLYHVSVYVDEFRTAVDALRAQGIAIDPLTVVMTPPAAVGDSAVGVSAGPGPSDVGQGLESPKRVVDIAWVPTSLTCGVNVELVDARPSTSQS